jgi:hypothetical protein
MRRMPRPLQPTPCRRTLSRRSAAVALLALATLPVARGARAAAAVAVAVELERDADHFAVTARAELEADARTAWDTLTDYARLPEFIPGLTRTRVLSRHAAASAGVGAGERLTVEYQGRFAMLFMSLPTRLWLDVQHVPYTEIRARSAPALPAGAEPPTLKSFRGRYGLTPVGSGDAAAPRLRLDYSAQFDLAEPLPPLIGALFGAAAMRRAVHEQFAAMAAEITRRARLRDAAARGG